nr:DUF3492 domain-containing protein [Streptomyces albus]
MLTEGGYPYLRGESALWCDRLLRGLDGYEFAVHALSRSARQEEAGWWRLPPQVTRVRTAPLWGPVPEAAGVRDFSRGSLGRRERRRFREHFAALVQSVCSADTVRSGETVRSGKTVRSGETVCSGEGEHGRGPSVPAGRAQNGSSIRTGGSSTQADRFAAGLYGLAELAAERGGLASALRSEDAVRLLEAACRAPGAPSTVRAAQVPDLLAVIERLERALRPLSLDWYGLRGTDPGLSAVDLCHAVGAGPAALPGLLAKHAFGVPLLITEYGVRLREHYVSSAASAAGAAGAAGATGAVARGVAGAPVRALLASFQRRLAQEAYAQAQLITPGNAHARRWQERCGAPAERLRIVYPGMDTAPFDAVGEPAGLLPPPEGPHPAGAPTLVWVGRMGPRKDLSTLLHAFARVREALPHARLRLVATGAPSAAGTPCAPYAPCVPAATDADGTGAVAPGGDGTGNGEPEGEYAALCRELAARLFPPDADGGSPVAFEEVGSSAVPTLADAYACGDVVVLSSTVEGFPVSLVEAMLCGRATVSTDAGAVREVIGGTGLVVPPRDARAFADACTALLCDPARAARLGAAARARALELFTVRQNVEAFRGIYLELMSHHPVRREGSGAESTPEGEPRPFARPAESHLPGRWAGSPRCASTASGSAEVCRTAYRPGHRPTGTRLSGGSAVPVPSWAGTDRAPLPRPPMGRPPQDRRPPDSPSPDAPPQQRAFSDRASFDSASPGRAPVEGTSADPGRDLDQGPGRVPVDRTPVGRASAGCTPVGRASIGPVPAVAASADAAREPREGPPSGTLPLGPAPGRAAVGAEPREAAP